jgi:hypothetical protein
VSSIASSAICSCFEKSFGFILRIGEFVVFLQEIIQTIQYGKEN